METETSEKKRDNLYQIVYSNLHNVKQTFIVQLVHKPMHIYIVHVYSVHVNTSYIDSQIHFKVLHNVFQG